MNWFVAYILGVTGVLALLTVYADYSYRRGHRNRERRRAARAAELQAHIAAALRGLRDGRPLTDSEIDLLARELVKHQQHTDS